MSRVVRFTLADGETVEVVMPGGFVIVLPNGQCGMVDDITSIRPTTEDEERNLRAAETDNEREGRGPAYLDLS